VGDRLDSHAPIRRVVRGDGSDSHEFSDHSARGRCELRRPFHDPADELIRDRFSCAEPMVALSVVGDCLSARGSIERTTHVRSARRSSRSPRSRCAGVWRDRDDAGATRRELDRELAHSTRRLVAPGLRAAIRDLTVFPPKRFLTARRMERAAELLSDPQIALAQVAQPSARRRGSRSSDIITWLSAGTGAASFGSSPVFRAAA
jgi:hypothetical protein